MRKARIPLIPLLVAAGLALYAGYRLHHVLIPFVLGAASAYVLSPLLARFESRGWRRDSLVMGLYLAAAAGIVLGLHLLLPVIGEQLSQLQENVPSLMKSAQKLAKQAQFELEKKLPAGGKLLEPVIGKILAGLQHLPGLILSLFPLISLLFLVPFITFFLLMDGPEGIEDLIQSCPSRYVEQILHLLNEVDTSLGNYLRGIIIVALIITGASFLGLVALGVDNAVLIAVLSGVSSFVPYMGLAVGCLVGGAMAFLQFGHVSAFAKVCALFIGIRAVEEAVVMPVISRNSVHLHPLTFLLSLMIGGELFGFMGLVFAVPAACVIKALIRVLWSWYASEARLAAPAAYQAAAIPYT
jgi:predicted PurR-regulated permease PerM